MAKSAAKAGNKESSGKTKALSLHIGLNGVSGAAYGAGTARSPRASSTPTTWPRSRSAQGIAADGAAHQEGDARRRRSRAHAQRRQGAGERASFFFLTYSGHGGQVPDVNGDEDDKKDETWCLYDGQLIDDELYYELSRFAAGVRILVLSDSCHSGTVTRAALMPPATIPTQRPKLMPDVGRDAHLPRAPGVLRQAAARRRQGRRQARRSIPTPRSRRSRPAGASRRSSRSSIRR